MVKRRWWIVFASLLIVAATSYGAKFLTVNRDMRAFFNEENPQLQALEALENSYNKTNNVLFILAPRNGDVFTRETLAAVEELTELAWRTPYSSRVDSVVNFQLARARGDELIVDNLARDAASLSDADLSRIKRIALSEPLLAGRLISGKGHVTGVNVNILAPGKSLSEIPYVADFARKMANDFRQKYPDIDIYIAGVLMRNNAFGEAAQNDMKTLIPLMFLIMVFIVGISLRSFVGAFVTLIVILCSMATGMGLAGWLGVMITVASSSAPTIIITLAVADSIHILATIFQRIRRGESKHESIAESIRINLQPVFLTSLTTIIGFLAMNFSDSPPFHGLGNIVAMGVAAAFLYSVLFMPALVAIIPMSIKPASDESVDRYDRLADFVIRRRKIIFWATPLVILSLISGILRIELNDDWIKYFDESYEIRQAVDFAEKNLTGSYVIEYSLDSGESGGVSDPDFLATADRFANWYRQHPKVVNTQTLTDTMKRLNKNMHGDDESWYRIPEKRDLAAQYLLLYEMSLPFGLDLNSRINVDKSAMRMIVLLKNMTTRELREMDRKARAWLKANAPETMFTYGSGSSIISAHISKRNIDSMLGASFIALTLISLVLALALRSVKLREFGIIYL